jgi:hypothetical protein
MEYVFEANPSEKCELFCNFCRHITEHQQIAKPFIRQEKYECDCFIIYLYQIWACSGCKDVTLEVLQSFDMDIDVGGDRLFKRVGYIPNRVKYYHRLTEFDYIPENLFKTYDEIVNVFNCDHFLLCSIGLRSLLEGICVNLNISGKTLEDKIEGLKLLLPEDLVHNLHQFRFMGNEAAHALEVPSQHTLRIAIELIEDILIYFYKLRYSSNDLRSLREMKFSPDENNENGGEQICHD